MGALIPPMCPENPMAEPEEVETKVSEEAAAEAAARPLLNGLSEIRAFFRTNTQPIYFIGATAFNLLGIDRFVRNFNYIAYYDSFDGGHPRVFSPKNKPYVEFKSSEEINNYLLKDEEVKKFIKSRGGKPKVAMVFFDEETEAICEELGYELILPPDKLRQKLDSKIVTTELGNSVGCPSVPNVLKDKVESWEELLQICEEEGLGTDLVIQTPYGDSGKTTFFIKSEDDWDKDKKKIIGEQVKIMKRINNAAAAVEAVLTKHGTVVGPFMTDLTGYPELTPYKGGWCGNDVFPGALSKQHRAKAIDLVQKFGEALRTEGYKGFFEFDVLIDLDDGEVYMGEVNPRISGASSMTNVTAGAYADIPLFLFHLIEYMDVDYVIDVDDINERWRELAAVDNWSQLIMKEPNDSIERILAAPVSGTYRMNEDGSLRFAEVSHDWHELSDEDQCFYLRVYAPGDYRFKGADLGILVTKGRMQTPDGLTDRARKYISAIREKYVSEPLEEEPTVRPLSFVK